jgi:hypothetical protein
MSIGFRSSAEPALAAYPGVLPGALVDCFRCSWRLWPATRPMQLREKFNWIYARLISDRFDADPLLAKTSTDIAKRMLMQTVEGLPGKDQRVLGALSMLLKTWLEDLPDPIRDVFSRDTAFCAKLGITVLQMVQIGAHKVAPEQFWDAAARALRSNSTVQVKSESTHLDVKIVSSSDERYLVVEDLSTMQRFELRDVPTGILSDSIAERYAAAQSIADQFDLRRKAAKDAAARLAQIGDTSERMGEFIALKRKSLHLEYAQFFRKLRAHEPIANSDFLPEDAALVTQHLRIGEISGHDVTFTAKLEAVGSALLEDVGVGQALLRLSSLPTPLPSSLSARLETMSAKERKLIVRSLIQELAGSPVATAHLVRLIGHFAADYPSYPRYRRMKIRQLGRAFDDVPGAAWLEVLKFFAREFWYVKGFRSLGKDIRLAVLWAHADRIFRTMAQAGADLAWVKTRFSQMSWKLAPEFVAGEEVYITDIANPDRLEEWPLTLALIAYASDNGLYLGPEIRAQLSERCLSEPGKTTKLFRDIAMSPNAMESLLRLDHDDGWACILEPQLVASISAFRSNSNLRELTGRIGSETDTDGWRALQAVIGDLPVPTELSEDVRQALLRADFVELYARNSKIAMLGIAFAAQHAAHFGKEVLQKIRERLLELADPFQRGSLA